MSLQKWFEYSINHFIPDNLKENEYDYRKAKILSAIHLFIIFFTSALLLLGVFFFPENQVSLLPGLILVFASFIIFKKCGNLIITGNFIAIIWAITVAPSVGETGGIYSDNLLWLIGAPLFAFLFANRKSGAVWTFLLTAFTTYVYVDGLNNANISLQQTFQYDASYYYASYLSLFLVILSIIYIFKSSQEKMIEMLRASKQELIKQKKEISKKAEELKRTQKELKSSNKELEHFAYAASHDLKEPLRMIGTYTQLIQKRIGADLDSSSKEYMFFVVDGVKRMQNLLDDLLEYSRLGKNTNFKNNDLNKTLLLVMNNLMLQMKETKATIYTNNLPVIYSSSTEMMQLLQNIISNGLKFQAPNVTPEITIKSQDKNDYHLISISDNGIGISEENQQKVFAMFERLHSKTEYAGTGIGLSTCKKIVNNLGGKIWLNSKEGQGTTFYFTLPKAEKSTEVKPSYSSATT